MSLFKKIMASTVGLGAAKIDTIVYTENIIPGNRIEGVCKVKGGKVEQYINNIAIFVCSNYRKEIDDTSMEVQQAIQDHIIMIEKSILPGEEFEVPFSFNLDKRAPITMHKSKVWLSTSLDIKHGIDKSDKDYIIVNADDCTQNVVNAILDLGFSLREVENEHCKAKLNGFNFIQEFEFIPVEGEYRRRLDELELVFIHKDTHTEILLEVDRKARGLMSFVNEALDLDETKLRIKLDNSRMYSFDEIRNEIKRLLEMHS